VTDRAGLGVVDVLVAGGGNAALCAALAARERGASVLVLERDSPDWRGGNSKYTRNVRCAHDGGPHLAPYPEAELLDDLTRVTGEDIDLGMAEFTIRESKGATAWMERQGVRWQPAMHGTLQLDRTNRFFLGGGKALLNTYYRTAAERGVDVRYGATVEGVELEGGRVARAVVRDGGGERVAVAARAVVAASGGFESNLKWLRRYWGDAVDNYAIRGTASNDGTLLAALLELGAMERGNPRGFHAVAVDARSPRYDGGIVTRVDSIPFSITVNRDGRRFHDEGEDVWPKRYATWGRLIAEQPGQAAFSIFDDKVRGRFIPALYPPVVADGIEELAGRLGLDRARLAATVDEYNRCVRPGPYDPSRLDGCGTEGLTPPKSNWALPIDTPPYRAYALRPGITFTYLGVAVDRQARVLDGGGAPFPGLYAAGEIMAGNVLLRGYLAGFGMTIGTVFGRLAGKEAADFARTR
jgi:tricarballylate dehydrogenase